MINEIKVSVKIHGFNDSPSRISEILGLVPTMSWLKGEVVHPRAINTFKENGWVISVHGDGEDVSIEKLAMELFDVLSESLPSFCDLPRNVCIEFSVVAYVKQDIPELFIPSEIVQKLGEIGAEIDIDLILT